MKRFLFSVCAVLLLASKAISGVLPPASVFINDRTLPMAATSLRFIVQNKEWPERFVVWHDGDLSEQGQAVVLDILKGKVDPDHVLFLNIREVKSQSSELQQRIYEKVEFSIDPRHERPGIPLRVWETAFLYEKYGITEFIHIDSDFLNGKPIPRSLLEKIRASNQPICGSQLHYGAGIGNMAETGELEIYVIDDEEQIEAEDVSGGFYYINTQKLFNISQKFLTQSQNYQEWLAASRVDQNLSCLCAQLDNSPSSYYWKFLAFVFTYIKILIHDIYTNELRDCAKACCDVGENKIDQRIDTEESFFKVILELERLLSRNSDLFYLPYSYNCAPEAPFIAENQLKYLTLARHYLEGQMSDGNFTTQLRPIVENMELHSEGGNLKDVTTQEDCDKTIETILTNLQIVKESHILGDSFNWDDDAWLDQAETSVSALLANKQFKFIVGNSRYNLFHGPDEIEGLQAFVNGPKNLHWDTRIKPVDPPYYPLPAYRLFKEEFLHTVEALSSENRYFLLRQLSQDQMRYLLDLGGETARTPRQEEKSTCLIS